MQEINNTNTNAIFSLKNQLEKRKEDADCVAMDLANLRRSTIVNSENSRTGKGVSGKVVDQIEGQDSRKEAEIIAARLEHIKLRNKIKRQEQLLKQKVGLFMHLSEF